MKKRYLTLDSLASLESSSLFARKKQKMKMAQLKQNKHPKLMEQSEIKSQGAAQKKSRSGQ